MADSTGQGMKWAASPGQTPWTKPINGAGLALNNAGSISIGTGPEIQSLVNAGACNWQYWRDPTPTAAVTTGLSSSDWG